MAGSQPNLRDSGHSAPAPSHRMRQNTREPGGHAGDLLDLGLAVHREEADAQLEGARDVALLLDGVAIGDAVRRRRRPPAPSRSRRPRRCRSRSQAWRAATALPAPGLPSPRRTRGCPAKPSRRRCSCRGRRRDRRRGSSVPSLAAVLAGIHGCAQSLAQSPQQLATVGRCCVSFEVQSVVRVGERTNRATLVTHSSAALDWRG